MVNLSVGVLTHPARAARLPLLLQALQEPLVDVVTDDGHGYWATAAAAWRLTPPSATHRLLLQDDILPCLDLVLGVRFAIEQRPTDVISLFSASRKLKVAAGMGYAWAIGKSLSWSQGIVLPITMIGDWLAWVERHCQPEVKSHDARLSAYLLAAGVPVLYTVPCLVEHDAPNESLIGNNRSDVIARTAGFFPGPTWSALSINWRDGAEHPFRLTTPGAKSFAAVIKPESPFAGFFA